METPHGTAGTGVRILALMDGSQEFRDAALRAADLFGSNPGAQFTVLAPAEIASPDSSPRSNGGTLMTIANPTTRLMQTVRLIEEKGFPTRMRTCEGSLLAEAARAASAHDLLILPRRMARFVEEFPIPVLVTG
jgi:hypothetical protein